MTTIAMMSYQGDDVMSRHVTNVMQYVIILLATLTVTASDERCSFLDNEAICDVMIASKYPVNIRATINQCSKPVDVTFHLQVINSSWAWSHTFANRDEIQRLPGLGEDALLQVALKSGRPGQLHVFAGFDVSSQPGHVVLDDMVFIQGMDNCVHHNNPNAYLPLVVFIILLILITALMATIVGFRRHRSNKRHSDLLSNMEPNSTSYRDDPSTVSSTTIKNDVYRDTVMAIADANGDATGSYSGTGEFQIRPPPPPQSGGRRKRGMLKNGLPQPVLERLPEEPGEDDCSSRELDAGINPSGNVDT